MAEASEAGIEKEQPPMRRKIWFFHFAAAKTPEKIDDADDDCRIERNSEKGVRETAMMSKSEGGAADPAEDVEIRGFSGECARKRGKCGLAIESGAPHAGAGQKVCDGFQAVWKDCRGGGKKCQAGDWAWWVREIRVKQIGQLVRLARE